MPNKQMQPEVGEQAKQVAMQARAQVEEQILDRKHRAAEELTSVATALRHASEKLRSEDHGQVTHYVERAADQVDKLSDYVESANLRQVVSQAEAYARREPLIFVGGAFALGLFAARFLKASRPREIQAWNGGERAM